MRAILACVVLAGCTAQPPAGAEPAPAPPQTPVDVCIESMNRGAHGRAGEIARDCAAIYALAPCRDANAQFNEMPVMERASRILRACADAYCPVLPDPKPSACDPEARGDALQRLQKWMDLRAAIWRHDLSAEDVTRLEAAMDASRTR